MYSAKFKFILETLILLVKSEMGHGLEWNTLQITTNLFEFITLIWMQ